MPAPPPPTSGPPSPDPDPDGAAFDAFLELLERGEQPDPRAFVTARAGVSASLVPQLERLAAAGGPPPLPDRIGPYRILGLLGRGGMGTVYLGRDEELERDVAVKVLAGRDGRFVSEHRIERLRREARILAALDHSGIARVHAFGTSADGAPYIAMERVEGSDLQRTLGAGPLPWRDALDVLRATANALAEAHARGVVHRDLKPSNLILLEGGGVKLLDFGLGASAGELVRGSDGSSVHGTPGYMSPEQRRGEPHAPSDDVWALGRLGLSALGHGDVGHEDTLPEEWTLPREAPRDVPGALWNVLGSFLEPRGADRPQNGGAAERALIGAAELLIAGARERLPRARTRFVGRRSLLDDLRARLDEGGLTTLTGPGGVGKTRAAHRVALERHEARWIALAGVRDGAVAAAVVEALGGRIGPDEEPLAAVERLAGELPSGTVVVLDNCEHVELEARAAALALLEGATVCATSRAPLGLGEERIVQVPPLEPAEAVALFEERARSAGARGPIEPEDTTAVAERLDRLPLALELAAARTPEL
ncbi:MAG: protein kinase, partial [Planctomycetota bacterium]